MHACVSRKPRGYDLDVSCGHYIARVDNGVLYLPVVTTMHKYYYNCLPPLTTIYGNCKCCDAGSYSTLCTPSFGYTVDHTHWTHAPSMQQCTIYNTLAAADAASKGSRFYLPIDQPAPDSRKKVSFLVSFGLVRIIICAVASYPGGACNQGVLEAPCQRI